MTMKKFLSVILSALFMFVSMLSVSAAQATAEIGISLDLFKVDVTVTADAAATGEVTAQITDTKESTGAKVLGGMDQTHEYTLTDDGKYQYQFHFKMQPTHESGTYWVHVGGGVETIVKEFLFINVFDKIDFYNKLDQAVKENDGIYNLITGEDSKLTYDLTEYKALSKEVRLLVDEKIEAIDLAATEANIEEIETRFTQEMDTEMLLAKIADANAVNWDATVKTAIEKKLLDGTYYDKLTSAVVMNYFKSEGKPTLEQEELSLAFDKACMLAVEEELDYISLKDAFDYYLEKDIISTNESNYKEIFDKKLENDLFKSLKNKESKSISALEKDADDIMKDLLDGYEEDDGNTGGGGSSGGSSGSRPSGSGSKNNNPGSGVVVDGDANNTNTNDKPSYNTNFSDLDSAQWAESSVKYLAGKGVVSGRGDGKFYPNDVMTREEFVKLIVLAFDVYDAGAECEFSDVSADGWSYRYIASAARLGLVTGNENNEFNPSGSITREDMAVIMHRVYSLSGLNSQAQALDFSDADSISGYAKEAVGVLTGAQIINGMGDGTFAPKNAVTRAQASKVVYELLMLIGGGN